MKNEDIPKFVRQCYDRYRNATREVREASKKSRKFYIGGEHQWLPTEITNRTAANRPYLSINCVGPAVDQVENEGRMNPPGPQCHPVGGGADKDGADILAGLIREYEYRSDAPNAYALALRYAAMGNYGVFEMATEYCGGRSRDQRIVIKAIEDPDTCFYDPNARKACREDAMWAGKIRVLHREQLEEQYPGRKFKIYDRSEIGRAAGWMQEAIKWRGDEASINEWTGGGNGDNGYWICEFYKVEIERKRFYRDKAGVTKIGDEIHGNVGFDPDDEGEKWWWDGVRTVKKHVVTALDHVAETEWLADGIPLFWVLGPETYIDDKCYRKSLIDGALDAQRGLNAAATSCIETALSMGKSPWVGWLGNFDGANSGGINPWDDNTKVWPYLEVKPAFAINPVTKEAVLLPPPQRNTWEAPIRSGMELGTWFREHIKSATSVFFDPSQQSIRDVQSGSAIKALQSQTNVGTFNWQDSQRRAVTESYRQAAQILPQIMDGRRVATIVRADSKHEITEMNKEFPAENGKPGGRKNHILGEFSVRCQAGQSSQTKIDEAIKDIQDALKLMGPQALAGKPAVVAQFVRMLGEGNPEVELLADTIEGVQPGEDTPPEQLRGMMTQMQGAMQQKDQVIQKLQQALAARMPDVEAKKFIALVDALAGIRKAEITASKDADNQKADINANLLEHLTGLGHEAALQEAQQEHERAMQQSDQQHAAASQASDQQAAAQQQEQANQGDQGQ